VFASIKIMTLTVPCLLSLYFIILLLIFLETTNSTHYRFQCQF